jgi:phage baseplate assembly protein W
MATGTQILSVPFRLNSDGTVATVTQGSDQANAEQIGVILATIQGEREMQPGFGIPDPAFNGIAGGVVAAQIALWGPDVTVDAVTTVFNGPLEADVSVSFT